MANSKYEYVRSFEQPDALLPNTWIVVRIDGRGFSKFTTKYKFEKPNDRRALDLMNAAAEGVMRELSDLVLAYGVSDEFSFVFHKDCTLFERRASKLASTIVSTFSSYYTFYWSNYFPEDPLSPPLPSFDGRAIMYPSDQNLRDYMSWRQADCHINNLYNTTFWALVLKGGADARAAEKELMGTVSKDKHELLFSRFGINYNFEPEIYKKGSVLYRDFRPVFNIPASPLPTSPISPITPSPPITPPRVSSAPSHKKSKSTPPFPTIAAITQDDLSPTSFYEEASAASTPAPRQTSFPVTATFFPAIGSIDTISAPPQPRSHPREKTKSPSPPLPPRARARTPTSATPSSSSSVVAIGSGSPSSSTHRPSPRHHHSFSIERLQAPEIPLRMSSIPSNAPPRKLSLQSTQSLHNIKNKVRTETSGPPIALPLLNRANTIESRQTPLQPSALPKDKGKGKAKGEQSLQSATFGPISEGVLKESEGKKKENASRHRTHVDSKGVGEGGASLSKTAKDKDKKKRMKAKIVIEHVDVIKDDFWETRPWILRGSAG